jgi:hypothetical protein
MSMSNMRLITTSPPCKLCTNFLKKTENIKSLDPGVSMNLPKCGMTQHVWLLGHHVSKFHSIAGRDTASSHFVPWLHFVLLLVENKRLLQIHRKAASAYTRRASTIALSPRGLARASFTSMAFSATFISFLLLISPGLLASMLAQTVKGFAVVNSFPTTKYIGRPQRK